MPLLRNLEAKECLMIYYSKFQSKDKLIKLNNQLKYKLLR